MTGRHPEIRCALSVARIRGHVIQPDGPFAVKRRGKDGRRTRMGKFRERFSRGSRQRVEHVRVAGFGIGHVVEKRAELGVRQLRRDVGHLLNDGLALERGGDHGADLAQLLGVRRVFARRRQETRSLGDIAGHLRGADDLAPLVPDGRDGERNR